MTSLSREFAGIGAAYRDEIDQCRGFFDFARCRPAGTGGDIPCRVVVAAAAGHGSEHALSISRLQGVGNLGPDRRQLSALRWDRCAGKVRSASRAAVTRTLSLFSDIFEMPALDVCPAGSR